MAWPGSVGMAAFQGGFHPRMLWSFIAACVSSFVQWTSGFFQQMAIQILASGPIPQHIAIIMDGNRRFADKVHLDRHIGHVRGFGRLTSTLKMCLQLGVKVVTVYAFSIDNFKRPKAEVDALMKLMKEKLEYLITQDAIIKEHGVQVRVLGDLTLLPPDVEKSAKRAMEATAGHSNAILNICAPYTSREEMVQAIRRVCNDPSDLPSSSSSSKEPPNDVISAPRGGLAGTLRGPPCTCHLRNRRTRNGNRPFEAEENSQPGKLTKKPSNGYIDHNGISNGLDHALRRRPPNGMKPQLNGSGPKGDLDSKGCNGVLLTGGGCSRVRLREQQEGGKVEGVIVEREGLCEGGGGGATEEDIEKGLYTAECPPPDLLIRTSGETRLSNFLLWQTSFTYLAFCNVLWPEFGFRHLAWAVLEYQRAEPRMREWSRLCEDTTRRCGERGEGGRIGVPSLNLGGKEKK